MQQPPTRPTRPAPAVEYAPAAPAAPATSVQGVPTTLEELNALRAKRDELAGQQRGLTERRGELTSERNSMGREEGRGHEARIRVIDERSARIEQEIFQADEAIASALASGVATGGVATGGVATSGGGEGQAGQAGQATTTVPVDPRVLRAIRNAAEDSVMSTMMGMTTAFVAAILLWRGFRRWVWKRKPVPALPDQAGRLDQLQQSVDVIAIEVERISEAQRFVAKVLNEKLPAVGAGEAQPIAARDRDAVPVRTDERR